MKRSVALLILGMMPLALQAQETSPTIQIGTDQDAAPKRKGFGFEKRTKDPFIPPEKTDRRGLTLTVYGGLTLSNLAGEDVYSQTKLTRNLATDRLETQSPVSDGFRLGGNGFVEIGYQYANNIHPGVALGYIQKGAEIHATEYFDPRNKTVKPVTGSITWIQNYLSLQIPVQFHFPINDRHESTFTIGLFFDFLLEGKEIGKVSIGGTPENFSNELGGNDLERGFMLGVSYVYHFPPGLGSAFINTNWNRSNTPYGIASARAPGEYYNQTMNFNIGYRLSLSHQSVLALWDAL